MAIHLSEDLSPRAHHVPLPPDGIVAFWKITAVMRAAGFLATRRGIDHQPGNRQQVLQLPADAFVEFAGENVAAPEADVVSGFLEPAAVADDAHLANHEGPQGVRHV